MTDTFKKLGQAQAPSVAGAIYTVPANTQAIVRQIRIVNTDTVVRTVTLFDGGTAAVNQILPPTSLQPGELFVDDSYITMAAAGVINAVSDLAAKVTITVYGLEIS